MNILSQFAKQLSAVSEGGNWAGVNVADSLNGLTWQEAGIETPASVNTIAALVHHITYWNRIVTGRVQGIDVAVNASNGFNAPRLYAAEDWSRLIDDYKRSVDELLAAIGHLQEDQLWEPVLPGFSTAYITVQGNIAHIHYHLGQIVIIKNLIRNAVTGPAEK